MRRREFIGLVGGAAAWPYAARAQQPERIRRIGVLMGISNDDPEATPRIEAFQQALLALGWKIGRNVQIHYRWGTANPNQAMTNAKELIDLEPDVIAVLTSPGVAAILRETRTIPIVFGSVADPVGSGFITGMSRPGANITGFSNFETTMAAKWLEVLIEMAPNVRRILFLFNPTTRPNLAYLRTAELAARAMALKLVPAQLGEPTDIENAINAFAQTPNGGLVVSPDVFMQVHRSLIVSFAAKYRLPAVYGFRYYVTDGGLMSYGHNTLDPYRQMPAYVDRIYVE